MSVYTRFLNINKLFLPLEEHWSHLPNLHVLAERLTDIYIPGKKMKVMTVIIVMEAVSALVLRAISPISRMIRSILNAEACDSRAIILLLSAF